MDGQTIEIEGEPDMFGDRTGPSIIVSLPLQALPRHILPLLPAVFFAMIGAVHFVGLIVFAEALANALTQFNPSAMIFSLFSTLFCFLLCIYCAGLAIKLVKDLLSWRPVLIIKGHSFEDTRTKMCLPWASIRSAVCTCAKGGDITGVLLALRDPIEAVQTSEFRLSAIFSIKGLRPTEVFVPLSMMNIRPHTLGHVIAEMVRANGGAGDARTEQQYWTDTGRRLSPRDRLRL